jgi:hypothetical protein
MFVKILLCTDIEVKFWAFTTTGQKEVLLSCSTDNEVTHAKKNREIKTEHIAGFTERNYGQ